MVLFQAEIGKHKGDKEKYDNQMKLSKYLK